MKQINQLILTAVLSCLFTNSFSQTINWNNLQPAQKHIVNLNVGFDDAAVVGIGYGYKLSTKMPLVLDLEYSRPFGEKALDDWKTKIGAQWNLVRANHFFAAVKAHGVIRRFENDLARMVNFGSEFSATAGLYKSGWFAATELRFDKAIITHLRHTDRMKGYNPGLQTGWYLPTGGNFFYGLQGGFSFKQNDVYGKAGRKISQ